MKFRLCEYLLDKPWLSRDFKQEFDASDKKKFIPEKILTLDDFKDYNSEVAEEITKYINAHGLEPLSWLSLLSNAATDADKQSDELVTAINRQPNIAKYLELIQDRINDYSIDVDSDKFLYFPELYNIKDKESFEMVLDALIAANDPKLSKKVYPGRNITMDTYAPDGKMRSPLEIMRIHVDASAKKKSSEESDNTVSKTLTQLVGKGNMTYSYLSNIVSNYFDEAQEIYEPLADKVDYYLVRLRDTVEAPPLLSAAYSKKSIEYTSVGPAVTEDALLDIIPKKIQDKSLQYGTIHLYTKAEGKGQFSVYAPIINLPITFSHNNADGYANLGEWINSLVANRHSFAEASIEVPTDRLVDMWPYVAAGILEALDERYG